MLMLTCYLHLLIYLKATRNRIGTYNKQTSRRLIGPTPIVIGEQNERRNGEATEWNGETRRERGD